jgi:hypothetical protein
LFKTKPVETDNEATKKVEKVNNKSKEEMPRGRDQIFLFAKSN